MKSRISTLLIIATLFLTACGAQRAVRPNDNSPKVQTSFFGAKFGEKGESVIKNRMSYNKAGEYWHAGNKGQWIMQKVSFAGREWDVMIIDFVDERFSGIVFTDGFNNKAEAMSRFVELRELFEKKYPLRKETFQGQYDNNYIYKDSDGNTISIVVWYMENSNINPWVCNVIYTWGKASTIAEKKALNEI